METKYYIGVWCITGLHLFGEDNKFYNVEDEIETDIELFLFTKEEAESVMESLVNFDFESLEGLKFELIEEKSLQWEYL